MAALVVVSDASCVPAVVSSEPHPASPHGDHQGPVAALVLHSVFIRTPTEITAYRR